jgi:uncharacterized protein
MNDRVESRATTRELTVTSGDVTLAGTLWLPRHAAPVATVYMHPGSGPSDRDNDVYFPPIRERLLASGFAVASFDKRGVGSSTGRWEDAGIEEQADDVLACLPVLLAEDAGPVGLFGHSQGGWVVIEAAGREPDIAFVVANSGPGVTPGAQERYSALMYLRGKGLPEAEIDKGMHDLDLVLEMLRAGERFDAARRRIAAESLGSTYEELDLPFVPENEAVWDFACALVGYDPRPALEAVRVPVLALFGAEDTIVPVSESVAVYREAVRPDLLAVAVLEGGDHRLQHGDPPQLVDGYLETLSGFIAAAVA